MRPPLMAGGLRCHLPFGLPFPARLRPAVLLATLLGTGWGAPTALASEGVSFGAHDVQTVFAIAKSDDHNQVQYAIQLDQDCRPRSSTPVFGYWRAYDLDGKLLPMSWLDGFAYGIRSQRSGPDKVVITIKTAPTRPIEIELAREADGRCVARPHTLIAGKRARLSLIFLKLSGPLSVAWVEIRGTALDTGRPIVERVRP